MAMKRFSLSANIELGVTGSDKYIVTPNVEKAVGEIVNQYQAGIHSYTIIGAYGTGKSCFLLSLEQDLLSTKEKRTLLKNPKALGSVCGFEILNIVGEYSSLELQLRKKLSLKAEGKDAIEMLRSYYHQLEQQNIMLVIAIDEFGKVLEYAAKNDVERELYFIQQLAEFVNVPDRNMLLLTTLHQAFGAYASKLNVVQKQEWAKVKGRFQEVVFAEPVEQLLYMAATSLSKSDLSARTVDIDKQVSLIHKIALQCKFVSPTLQGDIMANLYPLDAFSATVLAKAIQRYGQNKRSLFSFLHSKGGHSLSRFTSTPTCSYHLGVVYDYLVANFHSYLSDAHSDSMGWRAIQIAIERVETANWDNEQEIVSALKTVKAIGLLNLFGNAGFSMPKEQLAEYMQWAMSIEEAKDVLRRLVSLRIIRYADYKERYILFEGTDVNIEDEIMKAYSVVPLPKQPVDFLRKAFNGHVVPVKANAYHSGTPRYFEYMLCDAPVDIRPEGEVDGFIQLIFSIDENAYNEVCRFSESCEHAVVFAIFNHTDEIIRHLHKIQIYDYIVEKVLIDKSDSVALSEIRNLRVYEQNLLNKKIKDSLFTYGSEVTWFYHGKERKINSQRDFYALLSDICEEVYSLTPIINNELINRQKLSGNISSARIKYLQALLLNGDKNDLGWAKDKFPPEKTIYYSLLKTTGLHQYGAFAEAPSEKGLMTIWKACEDFLCSTREKPRKISELIKILSEQPYKVKMGVLDFWVPTYLYIKRLDYSLFGSNGAYVPDITMEFFDLLKKRPSDFTIKAYAEDGVKVEFYNQYRKFINAPEDKAIKQNKFIETIKPFFVFYHQLNEYAKHTSKFDNISTLRFRDVLAKAKDPEKTFFEDLPEALGYDKGVLNNAEFVANYCALLQRAVRELRSCYTSLIDRIEEQIIERLELQSFEYGEYIMEIRNRLSRIKENLLSEKQRDFHKHAMAEFDSRQEWYQSIAYVALSHPLERLRDDQEGQLIDNIVYLFRECEKHAVVSEAMSYQVTIEEKKRSKELENKIEEFLSDDKNLNIYTLMNLLKKRMI